MKKLQLVYKMQSELYTYIVVVAPFYYDLWKAEILAKGVIYSRGDS